MTEANEQEQKRPLTLRSGGTLGLRRPVETGQVRQSFSHGRSKTVTVEVRKKRTPVPGAAVEPGRAEPEPTVARAQPASLATSSRVVLATPTRATHASAASSTRSATEPADGEVGEAFMYMRQYCADRLIVSTCQASQQCSRSRAPGVAKLA